MVTYLHWLRKYRDLLIVAAVIAGLQGAYYWQGQREQSGQRHEGQVVEYKLCTTFRALAALKPPPGNPAANPSRAYLQAEHTTLVQLGTDLGCEGSR